MARSRGSSKRKRSSGSKDSDHYAKRHSNCTKYRTDPPSDERTSQSTNDSSSSTSYNVLTYSQVPYHSWLTYFHNQEYDPNSSTVVKINVLMNFFIKHPPTKYNEEIGLNFDINLFVRDSDSLVKWPRFVEDLKVYPQRTLNCIDAAFFEVMMQRVMREDRGNVDQVFKILRLNRTNILNHESINLLSRVELSSHGKLISISGIVTAVGQAKFSTDFAVLVCGCKRQMLSKERPGPFPITKKCQVCGNGRFNRLLDSPYALAKISQIINVKIFDEGATLPNIVSVSLTKSLVDKFTNGDEIRIIGIPRVTLGACKSSGSNRLYVEAKSIFKLYDTLSERFDTQTDPTIIQRIKMEPDVFSLLVNSLCPSVQGHEILKAALVLGLFAGTYKNYEIRHYVHILIIGNLGLGKSQLLRACAQVAADGTYIRGSSRISLGSTISAVRENSTEDYRFEGGALNLADRGLLCLDELDKMLNQHQILYNAMLKRRVSTMNSDSKIFLPARTSIFAMTNSTKKRYDPSKTVLENVNTSRQLLGQFDLIFLMRDNPDTYLDKLMSDRLLEEHTKRGRFSQQRTFIDRRTSDVQVPNFHRTLGERLVIPNGPSDLLPEKFFRTYLRYARSYVKPNLSDSSKIIIRRFCSVRRQKERDFRNFERFAQTLVALTEARAKIDLREETCEQDVFDAIEILEQSMSIVCKDFNQPRSSNVTNKLTANKIQHFVADLRREARQTNKNIFTVEELGNVAGQENMTGHTVSVLISRLNEQGYLLKISSNSYKLVLH